MPRKSKTGDTAAQTAQEKPKRSAAQRRADEKYSAKNRENQRENFGNIGATFQKSEKTAIKSIYAAAGITPAQAMRAAAEYLTAGGTSAAEKIKTAAAAYAERLHHQPAPAPTDTDTTSTTPDDTTTEEQM